MSNNEANPEAGAARERIGEILRSALGAPEEEALEDETRRLMLQLSIEPLDNAGVDFRAATTVSQARHPLLRRLLGKNGGAPHA
ncbi:MAG: hypothetical protein MT490_12860 [Sphingomonas sp.]|uniref:hypothetical protein n=1 Tax=Sphingomonas sp. TaxID=28214 RepID=UPI0022762F87|nr:hypothetical protein [Sphingomonas sp.]MCX8476682.1 hypothetical protein [Sphingomonas sp.]